MTTISPQVFTIPANTPTQILPVLGGILSRQFMLESNAQLFMGVDANITPDSRTWVVYGGITFTGSMTSALWVVHPWTDPAIVVRVWQFQ